MEYPQWAPKKLIDTYMLIDLKKPDQLSIRSNNQRDLLYKLITDSRMDKIWRMLLKKRKKDNLNKFGDYLMPYHLYFQVVVALDKMNDAYLTRKEEADTHTEIADAARHLSKLLKKSRLNTPPYKWYSSEAINTILEEDIKEGKCEGHFCLIHDDEINKKGAVYEEIKGLSGKSLNQYWRVAEDTQNWFHTQVISDQQSKISNIISELATDADTLAEYAMNKPQVVKRPKKISLVTIFIRELYVNYWRHEFEGPMNTTFASLCNVVIKGVDVDGEQIKEALKSYK